MSDELDPEVLADLRLREATAADRTRTGAAPVWTQPQFVTSWVCRHPRCSTLVPVTQEAVDYLNGFNAPAWTSKRGEALIPTDAVVVCDEHRPEIPVYRAQKLRERTERLALNIQALKASSAPRAEQELLAKIRADHHPDIDGLLQSIEERLGTKKQRRTL